MKTTIVRSYDSSGDAMRAAAAVRAAGIPDEDVSVVSSNADGWYRDDSSAAATGAGTGASIGVAAGGGAGLLAGLGMLAIPGLGPVVAAGWLAATAVGAAAGAMAGGAVGGIVGALADSGVAEEDAHIYAESVRRGGSVISVRADERRRAEIEALLDRSGPVDIRARGDLYRSRGWNRFDAKAPAYTPAQIAEERTLYENPGRRTGGTMIAARKVEGAEVYNAAGEHLGEVESVIIDKQSGKVSYAVMSFGGFLGIGEKYHPVPWSMLRYDTHKDGFVVPLLKHQLEGAPAYGAGEMRFADRDWNSRIYDYYKVPPYWG